MFIGTLHISNNSYIHIFSRKIKKIFTQHTKFLCTYHTATVIVHDKCETFYFQYIYYLKFTIYYLNVKYESSDDIFIRK